MDIKENLIEQLRKDKDLIKNDENLKSELSADRKEHDGIYMFFSFDLENSTKFKTIFPDKWGMLMEEFYNRAKKIFKELIIRENKNHISEGKFSKLKVWKLIGDEILFYKKVHYFEELFYNIKAVYYTLNQLYNELCEKGDFLDKGKSIIKSNIDIKASVWIGECKDNDTENCVNKIYINALSNEDELVLSNNKTKSLGECHNIIDFLGPDIDEGFRVGKYCSKRKITVSAKLAYLIYYVTVRQDNDIAFTDLDKEQIINSFRIVQYCELKGIWSGRLYPIVIYTHKWNNKEELFEYDEYFNNDMVRYFYNNKNEKNTKIEFLEKIFKDLNKTDEVEKLYNAIKNETYINDKDINENSQISRVEYINSEVHCVAICFYNSKVLLVKRSSSRKLFPELWECGCGKINSNESWKTCLEKDYKSILGVNIILNKNPVPIASYTYKKNNIIVPGIIFIAKIESDIVTVNPSKYSEYKFMTKDEVESLDEQTLMNNLKQNIIRGFELIKREDENYGQDKGRD